MTTIYHVKEPDMRHRHCGTYVDVTGCFELPVGPFRDRSEADQFIKQNADRLVELYGPESIVVASADQTISESK